MKRIVYFLYVLILFTATEGFGLRTNDWGAIGTGNFGLFSISQFLVVILLGVSLFYPKGDYGILKTKIGYWFGIFLLLFVVIGVELLFQVSLNMDASLSSFMNLFEVRYVLCFFVTIIVCHLCGVYQTFKVIFWSALVSAVIALGVVLFDVPSDTSIKIVMSEGSVVHAYRVLMPTATLISFGYLYALMSFRQEKKYIYLLAAFLCFAALLVQLHRSSTFSLLFVTLLFILVEYKIRVSSIIPTFIMVVVLFIAANLLFKVIGYSFDTLMEVAETTNQGMIEGTDNTASMRFDMIGKAWNYVVSHYGVLGIGLSWEKLDMENYLFTHFTLRPIFDSGYYNIIIMFGILGSVVFFIFVFRMFFNMYTIRKDEAKDSYMYKHSSVVMWTLIYVLLISFGGDNFIVNSAGVCIFYSLVAIAHVLVVDKYNEDVYSED